jgi:hypothetical protein
MRHRSARTSPPPLASLSRRIRRSPLAVPGALLTATAVGAAAVIVATSSAAPPVNLVKNPGFEQNMSGWKQSAGLVDVARAPGGHGSAWAARLMTTRTTTAELNDNPNTVTGAQAGSGYDVSAWVRVKDPSLTAALRIREVKRGKLVHQDVQSIWLTDTAWHRISLHYTVHSSGSSLDLNVLGWKLKPGNALFIDDVGMYGAPGLVGSTPTAKPTPTPTGKPTPTPTVTGTPTPTPIVTPSGTPPVPAPGSGKTMFGWAVPSGTGSPFATVFNKTVATFGSPQVVRVYYPGLPGSWSGPAGLVNRPVVVSFKALPQTILSGADDAALLAWFNSAPTNRPIWWSYYHEPEDNIARGEFTAADYRAAWVHIAGLADAAHHSNLKATLILMCWTLNPQSGRNFSDYYPGSGIINTLGWDCYNAAYTKGGYDSPASIFGRAVDVSRNLGKPFGIAEWGSQMAVGDNGTGRGAWISLTTTYLRDFGTAWATYFDSNTGGTFVLNDRPSITAISASLG